MISLKLRGNSITSFLKLLLLSSSLLQISSEVFASCPFSQNCDYVDYGACGNSCCGMRFFFKNPSIYTPERVINLLKNDILTKPINTEPLEYSYLIGPALGPDGYFRLSHIDGEDGSSGFGDVDWPAPIPKPFVGKLKKVRQIGQLTHEVNGETKRLEGLPPATYNDTINFLIYSTTKEYSNELLEGVDSDSDDTATVLYFHSISQTGGAYTDSGQNYYNIMTLIDAIRDKVGGDSVPEIRADRLGCSDLNDFVAPPEVKLTKFGAEINVDQSVGGSKTDLSSVLSQESLHSVTKYTGDKVSINLNERGVAGDSVTVTETAESSPGNVKEKSQDSDSSESSFTTSYFKILNLDMLKNSNYFNELQSLGLGVCLGVMFMTVVGVFQRIRGEFSTQQHPHHTLVGREGDERVENLL